MADLPVQYYTGRDGTKLAYRELGQGRPVVLIHGYFSNAVTNWIRYGHAAAALGGYSLGGRTTARMLVRGATPARAVIAGMGLDGIVHASGRNEHFRRILSQRGQWDRRSPEGKAEAFMNSTGADPVAGLHLLDASVDTPPEALAAIGVPVLVLAGTEDDDNGTAEDLAAVLPRGRAARVPGNHMSAVAQPDLGRAIAAYLAED